MAEARKHVENRVNLHGRREKTCGKEGKVPW